MNLIVQKNKASTARQGKAKYKTALQGKGTSEVRRGEQGNEARRGKHGNEVRLVICICKVSRSMECLWIVEISCERRSTE